jgi:hypothetical protein
MKNNTFVLLTATVASVLALSAFTVNSQAQQVPSNQSNAARARIVVTGDLEVIGIGQQGVCGAMDQVTKSEFQRVTVPAAKRTWLRVVHSSDGESCIADGSFIPEANQAYIVRFINLKNACVVELFKIVPGADPARMALQTESTKECPSK